MTNRILAALPEQEYQRLVPHIQEVALLQGEIIYPANEAIEHVYFPTGAAISIVSIMEDGSSTEICLVGKEGMVGLPVILGDSVSPHLVLVSMGGTAIKISAQAIAPEFARGEALQRFLLLYTKARLTKIGQLVACNGQHVIEERLARWLLSVSDCLDRQEFMITQEAIANLLGVRRSGIAVAASMFQRAGIVRYSRGQMTIVDREALEETACECYRLIESESSRLFGT
ncbi:MAG: Crp/Fnr family transcriptional regulator [Xenococcaceae cyanobacterium]